MRLVEGAGTDGIFDFIEEVAAVFQQQKIDADILGFQGAGYFQYMQFLNGI